MHVIRASLAFAVLLGACSEPNTTKPEPQPYTVVTPDVWAGEDVLITSPGFAPAGEPPSVSINGVTVNSRFVNETTLAVATPSARGSYVLRVSSPYVMDLPATVFLRGFIAQETGPSLFGRLEVLPGPPAVLGQVADGVVRWNIQARTATRVMGVQHDGSCVWGIGSSYTPSHLVLHYGTCPIETGWSIWRMAGTPTPFDSIPLATRSISVELAPKKTLYSDHHEFWLVDCDTTPCRNDFVTAERVTDVVFSPPRHRLVPLGAFLPPDGVPIVDPATARVVYRIPRIRLPYGAAFSLGGDTLFVGGLSGSAVDAPSHIVRARASDGQVDTIIDVPQTVVAIEVDPVRPWLYIMFGDPPSFDVWDRRTLTRIASFPIPGKSCLCFWKTKILPSPLEHRVYVASTHLAEGAAASLLVFDTPP